MGLFHATVESCEEARCDEGVALWTRQSRLSTLPVEQGGLTGCDIDQFADPQGGVIGIHTS